MNKASSLIQDPEHFDLIKRTISKLVGFNCSQYSDSFITRRIEVRLRANNLRKIYDYKKILERDDLERAKLKKELSIHVTNFFRDKSMWHTFQKEIIPLIKESKKRKHSSRINIWSAGCSTGEEPLSIVICFLEQGLDNFSINIQATDIDPDTIVKAKQAIYEPRQFREMDRESVDKYFEKQDGGAYKAKSELLRYIHYHVEDIHSYKPKNIDLIFCRNTVIYFNKESKSKLYEEFFKLLNHEGFFIMGKTEILQGEARTDFQIYNGIEKIYFKE